MFCLKWLISEVEKELVKCKKTPTPILSTKQGSQSSKAPPPMLSSKKKKEDKKHSELAPKCDIKS